MKNTEAHRSKINRCHTCYVVFRTEILFNKHKKVHCDEKPFKCGTCEKSIKTKKTFRRHTLMHTKDISHRSYNKDKLNCCPNCWIVYKTPRSLKVHLTAYCKRKSYKVQETALKQNFMTTKVGKRNLLFDISLGINQEEEGELSYELEEGEF